MVGIVSYGAYIPKYRIKIADIAKVWQKQAEEIVSSLGIEEKSVPAKDEDTVTLAVEAALQSIAAFQGKPEDLEVVLVGSESHPYAVNPTSTIVAEFLGLKNSYLAADLEFACKAGTAAVILISGLISSNKARYGLAIGADTAQSKPHDVLEYSAASGAAAFILGGKKEEIIAEIVDFTSFSSDTPDFWRRDGVRYPSHGGRFTGEPAYFTHVLGAAKELFKRTKTTPADFDYCVFHMPNGKFPQIAAKRLGFNEKQIKPSFIVPQIGNPYSASSLIGLANILETAKPNQTILLVSYGSGAGSDAFILKTTEKIKQKKTISEMISEKEYIDYVEYLKRMKVI